MSSRKTVRFSERIQHSDREVTYLWPDDDDFFEMESSSSSGESSSMEWQQQWNLTEGIPPSLLKRKHSFLLTSVFVQLQRKSASSSRPLKTRSSPRNAEVPSNIVLQDSRLGDDMAKIRRREITKLANVSLCFEDQKDPKPLLVEADSSSSSERSSFKRKKHCIRPPGSSLESDNAKGVLPNPLPTCQGAAGRLLGTRDLAHKVHGCIESV